VETLRARVAPRASFQSDIIWRARVRVRAGARPVVVRERRTTNVPCEAEGTSG